MSARQASNESEQLLSDHGVLGGHHAGLPRALFRYRNVRSFRPARELRITWPHGPRARQCHCDKSGREDRPHDGICFEPSIECALVLRGQSPIVKNYAAFSHDTLVRLGSSESEAEGAEFHAGTACRIATKKPFDGANQPSHRSSPSIRRISKRIPCFHGKVFAVPDHDLERRDQFCRRGRIGGRDRRFRFGRTEASAGDDHRRSSHDADRGDKSYSPHCQSPSSTSLRLPWHGQAGSSPVNRYLHLAQDEPGAATRPVSYFTVEKNFFGGSGNWRASCGISSRLAQSGGSDAQAP